MESIEKKENIKFEKQIAHDNYLNLSSIDSNQIRLHDQYIIWLSAGMLAIAIPQIINLINIKNSNHTYLLLISTLSLVFTLLMSLITIEVSSCRINYLLRGYDIVRHNGKLTKEGEKINKKAENYKKWVTILNLIILFLFIVGIIALILFLLINHKLINTQT